MARLASGVFAALVLCSSALALVSFDSATYSATVRADAFVGFEVLRVHATADAAVTYTLQSNNNFGAPRGFSFAFPFALDANTGAITVKSSLTLQCDPYVFTVLVRQVADGLIANTATKVTITVVPCKFMMCGLTMVS